MTKYTVFVDHKGGFGRVDKVKPLEAQDQLGALKEAVNFYKGDQDIFEVVLYELVNNDDEYKVIMRSYDGKSFWSYDGKSFCVEGSPDHWERGAIVRNTGDASEDIFNEETAGSSGFTHSTSDHEVTSWTKK